MKTRLHLVYLAALWTGFCSTQTQQTAWVHIADDAYDQNHQGPLEYFGGATITNSTTIYSIQCLAQMNGCSLSSQSDGTTTFFPFTAISGITTYSVGEGPNGGVVQCQPSFTLDSAFCTRTFTPSGNSLVLTTTSIDEGYYHVIFTNLQNDVASAIGATAQSVSPSIFTDTVFVSASATSTQPATPPSKASSIPPSTSSPPPPPSPTSSPFGPTTGGKIGVGVGVGVGVPLGLLAGGAAGFLLYRRRRSKRTSEGLTPELNFENGGVN